MTIWTFQNDHSKGKKEQRRRGKTVSMSATKVQNRSLVMAAELQQALQSPLSTLLINFFVPWSLGLHFTSVIAITLKSCQTDKR